MARPLRVIIVEDDDGDFALLLRELRGADFELQYERVQSLEALRAALSKQAWDVVLSDYLLPKLTAPQALAEVQRQNLDLPFIVVSGTVGEDAAVEVIRAGARDFMSKRKLGRLIPALERELRDAAVRAENAAMQKQLLVAERMVSVGTLAAGVAHEINNPLATLIANLDFLEEDLASLRADVLSGAGTAQLLSHLDALAGPLEDMKDGSHRVRNIVRDLKVFSRGSDESHGAVELKPVLDSAIRMAANELRHRAQLVTQVEDVPPVHGNDSRLGQVFLNLLINAAHSIPEGRAAENEVRVTVKNAPRGVVVTVSDTGSGIAPEVLPRIFDPFFTTKAFGVGMGLGLAISHRIVSHLGGTIAVTTERGRGSRFEVTLLRSNEPLRPAFDATASPTARRARVLVIDDEAPLAVSIGRMLSRHHDVVITTSARDALRRLLGGERYGVVLCDLMLPDMTGMELYAELRKHAPDQASKLIFMTGGAFTEPARAFLEQVKAARLEKPFTATDLLTAIRRAVGDP